jgi:polyisoprenyl-phosphate glycosyltransferase
MPLKKGILNLNTPYSFKLMMKKISIVIPVYNEPGLTELIPRLFGLKEKIISYEFEFVFVDDGSKDNSLEILLKFKKKFPKEIKIVKFTRNFGYHAAVRAGLKVARGDAVGVISADLQDPPELFVDMVKQWENGSKEVLAVRKERQDSFPSKIIAKIYYYFLRKYAFPNVPKGGFDCFLIDREVVDNFNKVTETNSPILNILIWLGYNYTTIPYVRQKRKAGKSGFTLGKKIRPVIDSFIGFSDVPIKLLPIIGCIFAISSFGYGITVFYYWFIGKIEVPGWTSTIILVTFIGGIQMIMLGVLGEYLKRALDQSRNRPIYIIDEINGNEEKQ